MVWNKNLSIEEITDKWNTLNLEEIKEIQSHYFYYIDQPTISVNYIENNEVLVHCFYANTTSYTFFKDLVSDVFIETLKNDSISLIYEVRYSKGIFIIRYAVTKMKYLGLGKTKYHIRKLKIEKVLSSL